MDNTKTVIIFMNDNLYLFEIQYDDVNRNVLKAAIAYKYLLHIYLNIQETIHEILKEQEDIGLIGPGHTCLTSFCEKGCSSRICHLHSILHDIYSRIYTKYKVSRGYNYMFNAPNFTGGKSMFKYLINLAQIL